MRSTSEVMELMEPCTAELARGHLRAVDLETAHGDASFVTGRGVAPAGEPVR